MQITVNPMNWINPSNNCKSNEPNKSLVKQLQSVTRSNGTSATLQQRWRASTYNTNKQQHTECTHCEHTVPINSTILDNFTMINNSHIPQTASHDHLLVKNNITTMTYHWSVWRNVCMITPFKWLYGNPMNLLNQINSKHSLNNCKSNEPNKSKTLLK